MTNDQAETSLTVYDIALQLLLGILESTFVQLTGFGLNKNHAGRVGRGRTACHEAPGSGSLGCRCDVDICG
jgi:hypothetical protein